MPYGDRDGLVRECTGLPMDRLGDWGVVEQILDDELDTATELVEDLCNRLSGGFNNNAAAAISVDGTGSSVIRLSPDRYVPLISVSAIVIDDTTQTLSNFTIYDDGRVEFARDGTNAGTAGTLATFTPGTKNIDLTITWGYATTPDMVIRATYLLAKAAMMDRIADAIDPTDASVPPGVLQWQMGEYSVRFDKDGQYGPQVKRATKRAKTYLRRYVLVTMTAPRGRRAYRGSETSDATLARYRADA